MTAAGSWHLVIDSPMGRQENVINLIEEDGRLSGTITNAANSITSEIFDGGADGDQLSWKVKMKQLRLTLAFSTTVHDDTMTGKVKAGIFGSFDVSGRRDGAEPSRAALAADQRRDHDGFS